ncbi:hypothetical protein EJB05_49087, partial [Eragrostis curvula]
MEMVPLSLQKGVVRTNCIDFLDHTNGAQFAFGCAAFKQQLNALGLIGVPKINIDDHLCLTLMDPYEQMGDALAIRHTGSAAQNKIIEKKLHEPLLRCFGYEEANGVQLADFKNSFQQPN